MKMELRSLTDTGIAEFRKYHAGLKKDPALPVPVHLLTDEPYSLSLSWGISIQDKPFSSRHELAEHLVTLIGKKKKAHELSSQEGLWTWLALRYFEQICRTDDGGNIYPAKDESNYILGNRKNWHRHAIRTTYMFVERYGDAVKMMFSKLDERGEVTEQLSATPYLYSCRGIMETAGELYTDALTSGFKRGAASSRKGGARRLVAFLNQITLTYDIYSMSKEQLLNLLPSEFNRFKASLTIANATT